MTHKVFCVAQQHAPKDGLTISSPSGLSDTVSLTWFSLGAHTNISAESYNRPVLYLGLSGRADFGDGAGAAVEVGEGDVLLVNADTLCDVTTEDGFVYAELMAGKDLTMDSAVEAGKVFKLAELVPYEKDSIVNRDITTNDAMKFMLMAFDEGQALNPHRAPGEAIVFALEGKATITYEGVEHTIHAGENFHFAKGGLHAVAAQGRFKMALLLTLK